MIFLLNKPIYATTRVGHLHGGIIKEEMLCVVQH